MSISLPKCLYEYHCLSKCLYEYQCLSKCLYDCLYQHDSMTLSFYQNVCLTVSIHQNVSMTLDLFQNVYMNAIFYQNVYVTISLCLYQNMFWKIFRLCDHQQHTVHISTYKYKLKVKKSSIQYKCTTNKQYMKYT